MDFNELNTTELDRDLSESQRKEWNAIYASLRSGSMLSGRVIGMDAHRLSVTDEEGGARIIEINCLVIISYRVKVLIPQEELWFDEKTKRPPHVLRSMIGANVDYIITHIEREDELCLASRRRALQLRRNTFSRFTPRSGDRIKTKVIATGENRILVECGGFDIDLRQRDLSYAMIPDCRQKFHPGEEYDAVFKFYDEEKQQPVISIKEVEPHPFTGADIRHPLRSRRASVITGKHKGGVFCKLEENLDCLCTYAPNQYDGDFNIGDQVIVAITKFDFSRKLIYGKIVAKW